MNFAEGNAKMTVLISLIGEQPIPNLLPIKLENPDIVVLIHSDFTASVAANLKGLISVPVISKALDAYDIAATEEKGLPGQKAVDTIRELLP